MRLLPTLRRYLRTLLVGRARPAAVRPGNPSAIIVLAPGGSLSTGEHHALVEIKAAKSTMVIDLAPGTLLATLDGAKPLTGHHLTVHDNLMVHVRTRDESTTLRPAAVENGKLISNTVRLATVSAPPAASATPHRGRFQSRWDGRSAILSFLADVDYDATRTHVLIDLWATSPHFDAPGLLPSPMRGARPAAFRDGQTAWGPIPAEWAFHRPPRPPCEFFLRFWFFEAPHGVNTPLVAPPLSQPVTVTNYDIRGWGPAVTFAVGDRVLRLSPTEALSLANTIEVAAPIEVDGQKVVPLGFGDVTVGFPATDAVKVPAFLRSAAAYARREAAKEDGA